MFIISRSQSSDITMISNSNSYLGEFLSLTLYMQGHIQVAFGVEEATESFCLPGKLAAVLRRSYIPQS